MGGNGKSVAQGVGPSGMASPALQLVLIILKKLKYFLTVVSIFYQQNKIYCNYCNGPKMNEDDRFCFLILTNEAMLYIK